MQQTKLLVFTDLDGTLLGHYGYDHQVARDMLRRLDLHGIPVIAATSKTRAEMAALQFDLGLNHPCICENGALVCIPRGYFRRTSTGEMQTSDFVIQTLTQDRAHWQRQIDSVAADFVGEFITFREMGVEGVMQRTGLPRSRALLAMQRDCGEPLHWLGSEHRKQIFMARIRNLGGEVQIGGRFLHVSGHVSKANAMQLLVQRFAQEDPEERIEIIALGDSENDRQMLEQADHSVVVSSPVHPPLSLSHPAGLPGVHLVTRAIAPEGWVEGVTTVLSRIGFQWSIPVEVQIHG